jgi:hypothetical protein
MARPDPRREQRFASCNSQTHVLQDMSDQSERERGFSRGAIAAALVAGLLIGAAATYALAAASLSRTTTTTTITTITTTTGLSSIKVSNTTTVTTSQLGQSVADAASDGLRLSTSINATDVTVGQSLNISISLFNTLATSNAFQLGNMGAGGNRTFYGVPVVTWPECSLLTNQIFFGYEFPIEVIVLDGNYTARQLSSLANASLPTIPCTANDEIIVPTYAFEPESDVINITYFGSGGGHGSLGTARAVSNFTLGGYWNFTNLEEQANGSLISEPALCRLCKVPSTIPFVPGVYTVGVSDEWGQYDVVHFQVRGSGSI